MWKSRTKSALTLLFATALTLSLSVGCSKQGEGERCDSTAAGDTDCEDGLVCTNVGVGTKEDRCCPPDGATPGDSRCMRTGTSTGGQSSTGGAGGGGGASSGGASNGGNGGMSSSGGSAGSSADAGAPAQGGSEGG